jgi:hypothetical protein
MGGLTRGAAAMALMLRQLDAAHLERKRASGAQTQMILH